MKTQEDGTSEEIREDFQEEETFNLNLKWWLHQMDEWQRNFQREISASKFLEA